MIISGITSDTVIGKGGKIGLYPADHRHGGEPDGVLYEEVAYGEVLNRARQENNIDIVSNVTRGIDDCLHYGLTSVHTLECGSTWKTYCDLVDNGKLPIRVFYSAYYELNRSDEFPRAHETHGDLLSCDRIKIFQDGALGPSTAALSIPYIDQHQCGIHIQSQVRIVY